MRGMRTLVRRTIAAAEVSRLPVAFGAVANVWLMVLMARTEAHADGVVATASAARIAELQPVLALIAAAAFAVGFMAFGASLNDVLDAKHDRAFAPDRPIPSGSLSTRRAFHIAFAALVVGVLGTIPFGAIAIGGALALAVAVLAYDAFAKHIPALGIVLAGLATAISMVALCPDTPSLLPVWLAMSQTMGVGLAAYLLADKRPKLTRRAVLLGAVGWLFWSATLFLLAHERNGGQLVPTWYDRSLLFAPSVAVVTCAAFALWKLRHARGLRASEKLLRYGSLWKALVAASWLVVIGRHTEAAWVAGIAVGLAVAFAVIREIGPQVASPVGWRS
jgi:4-hydroxybenzoate polyprenyltransferase